VLRRLETLDPDNQRTKDPVPLAEILKSQAHPRGPRSRKESKESSQEGKKTYQEEEVDCADSFE
jgi:hypothetical protein